MILFCYFVLMCTDVRVTVKVFIEYLLSSQKVWRKIEKQYRIESKSISVNIDHIIYFNVLFFKVF